MVLARLLAPEEYGRVAMAKVVITFTNIFREMGTSAALIKKRELTNRTTTAVFWFNLSAGCLVAIIVGAVAPLTARGFRTEALTAVT